jgi:hsp70-interacting protein
MDPKLNELLKWGIANSTPGDSTSNGTAEPRNPSNLDPAIIDALFGGPSDAELMKESMAALHNPEIDLENKLIAFDNFEQLIENLDNANNLGPLALWSPLLELLAHESHEMRLMAAWCIGTAVQNNEKSQENLLAQGGIPKLVKLATNDQEPRDVRRKAIYALSSASRNYQPSMDILTEELEKTGRSHGKVDAADMEAVDTVISGLREEASKST